MSHSNAWRDNGLCVCNFVISTLLPNILLVSCLGILGNGEFQHPHLYQCTDVALTIFALVGYTYSVHYLLRCAWHRTEVSNILLKLRQLSPLLMVNFWSVFVTLMVTFCRLMVTFWGVCIDLMVTFCYLMVTFLCFGVGLMVTFLLFMVTFCQRSLYNNEEFAELFVVRELDI